MIYSFFIVLLVSYFFVLKLIPFQNNSIIKGYIVYDFLFELVFFLFCFSIIYFFVTNLILNIRFMHLSHNVANVTEMEYSVKFKILRQIVLGELDLNTYHKFIGKDLYKVMLPMVEREVELEKSFFIIYSIFISSLSAFHIFHYSRKNIELKILIQNVEKRTKGILFVFSLFSVFVAFGILVSLFKGAVSFFGDVNIFSFLFGVDWHPELFSKSNKDVFGFLPLLLGTVVIALYSIVFSSFLALFFSIYVTFYLSAGFRKFLNLVINILAGIPSIVYGFFAAMIISPYVISFGEFLGFSVRSENALTAAIAIAFMIVPLVISVINDTFFSLPKTLLEGALALGSYKHEAILRVLLPASVPGILNAVLLGFARAVGETMIVVIASGTTANMTFNPFDAVTTITAQIVLLLEGEQSFDSPMTKSLFALGFFLMLFTLFINFISKKVVRRFSYLRR